MRSKDDPKLKRWLAEHPDRPFNWDGPTAPAPANVDDCPQRGDTGQPLVFEDLEGKDFGAVVDALLLQGASPVDATRFVCSIVKSKQPIAFHELYGQGNLCKLASEMLASRNVTGLRALDMRTKKPNGQPWDFRRKEDRRLAMRLQDEDEPDWLVGAPPCTDMCTLNVGTNFSRMDPAIVAERKRVADQHTRCVSRMYRRQMAKGNYFLHKRPRSSQCWKHPSVRQLLQSPNVHVTKCHQCPFGLTATTKKKKEAPVLKPTRFMSNSL